MKKFLILVLAVVLLFGLLVVCHLLDGKGVPAAVETTAPETSAPTTEATTAPMETTTAPTETTVPETTESTTAPTFATLPKETEPVTTLPPAPQPPAQSGSREDEFPLTPIG